MRDTYLNNTQLIAAMEENYVTSMLALACVPYVDLQKTQYITSLSSSAIRSWNIILETRLTEASIVPEIEAMVEQYDALHVPLTWHILPSSRPSKLAAYLEDYDFLRLHEEPHMVKELAQFSFAIPSVPGMTIERVTDRASLERWNQVLTACFFPTIPVLGQFFLDAYTALGLSAQSNVQHYTGYINGEPVAASTLLFTERIAGIYDICTLPQFRDKGIGTAITLATLAEAKKQGYHYACLQATSMGYSLYRRMGFTELYREYRYLHRP